MSLFSRTFPRTKPALRAKAALLAAWACCFPAIPGRAQDQALGTIRVNVDLVMVDATVKTKTGQIMNDLKLGDFEVREDGKAQKLGLFSRDTLPLDIVLLLDLSASTEPYLGPLRYAATIALAALKPEDEVALITFSTKAEVNVPLSADKGRVAEVISTLPTGGTTNINGALFAAASYLRTAAPRGRRAIILISDNVATDAGSYETREIISETIAADASVYSLKLPDHSSFDDHYAATKMVGLVDLHKVLEQTGGEIFDARDVLHMGNVFRDLIERIKTRYTLGYYTSTNAAKGSHKLDIRLASSFGSKGRNYVVLARNSYFSP